ncbi:MAG TPA: hypothetical protein VML75_19450, partial [Kofleriaceae bacterium]|nr:hypothetical protein [Kofleriaceae bacterium]
MSQLIFVVLLAAALGYFATTMYAMVRAASRGSADPRPRLDQLPRRLASVLIYFIGQKKVAEEGPMHMTSKHHLLIVWGFLRITLGTVELLVAGVWPSFTLDFLMPRPAYVGLRWIIDLFNLIVLMMVGWALFRRIVIQPRLIPMNLDAGLILGAIASLMVTHFLYHGFLIAAGEAVAGAPVSAAVGGWLQPIRPDIAVTAAKAAVWIHVIILLAFLNYLPYSKHIH